MAKGKRKVVVRITSDVNGLKKGIFEADLTLKNFAKTSRAAANVAGKALATGAAAAATGLAAIYAKTAPLIAQQKDFAEQLGLTYDEVTGLGYAAEVFGSNADTFNSAIDRMQRRVGLAAKGTGAAKNAIKELGFEAADLAKLKTDEQFKAIADRIAQVDDRAAQAAFAFEIFGNQGQALLTMINAGSDAMEEQANQARRLGVALSDVDAQKVADADQAMMKAGQAVQGIFNRITVQLAPAVSALASLFVEAADEAEGFNDEVATGFDILIEGAALAANALHGLEVIWGGIKVAVGAALTAISATLTQIVKGWDLILGGLNKAINTAIRAVNRVAGTEIPELDTSPLSGPLEFLEGMTDALADNVVENVDKIHNKMMEPLKGDVLKESVRKAYEDAQAAAEAAVGGGSASVSASVESEIDPKEMEAFRQSLLTKEEAEIESYQRRLEQFALYKDQLYATEEERVAAMQELERQHVDALTEIRRQGMTDLQKFNAMSWGQQTKDVTGALVDMTSGVAQYSRKMFEVNKAAGIANAIVSAYEGISKTMAAYPYPINIGLAAAHAAAAFAQVRAIQSASFNGGGRGGAPSQAPTPSTPVHEAGGGRSGGGSPAGQDVVLHMRGEVFGRETVLGLIEGINSALDDGAQLRGIKVTG